MMSDRRPDGSVLFAGITIAFAVVAFAVVIVVAVTTSTESAGTGRTGAEGAEVVDFDDGATADPNADADTIVADAAIAMGDVTSVEFELDRGGAPVFIDQFESIALDSMIGQFVVPGRAAAALDVEVDGSLNTRIGAVAIDDEVWISNPVTGDFETLPTGYDIDPSKFFDPEGGWQPLLANLTEVELVAIDDRGGERYHIRGVAPADQVENITVGLVEDQDVPADLWIHPSSSLVTALEFVTTIDGDESTWVLELGRYGEEFTIEPPENVTT